MFGFYKGGGYSFIVFDLGGSGIFFVIIRGDVFGFRLGVGVTNFFYVFEVNGVVYVFGVLSKGSGFFKIDYLFFEMKDMYNLYYFFIEGLWADFIYRGKVRL